MVFIKSIFQKCLIYLIYGYRFAIRGFLGPSCRFEPSCSSYAIEALQKHGCGRGCFYIARRLICCHPWHPGGIDPVPEKVKS